jgi:fibronectin type 3 domain-containing protein
MPAQNAKKKALLNISRVDIYRLAEPLTSPRNISEEEFASRSVLIAAVPVEETDFGGKAMTYSDRLQFAGQAARLRYAVRFVNASGQKAAFSNFFLFEPTASIAREPTSLFVDTSQDAVQLRWKAPDENVDGTRPANIVGYNIYRSGSKTEAGKLLNKTPVSETTFNDVLFEFKKEYHYFVRTVSSGSGGRPVESAESEIVTITPIDLFVPSAPTSITLASTLDSISIFFPANPEKDIAGYRIFRSTDPGVPQGEWKAVTPEPITTTTYQDKAVTSGTTYYYYVRAVDTTGNVSAPSEVVSESVP